MATSKYFKSSSSASTQKSLAHEDEHGAANAPLSPTNMLNSLEKLFAEISKMNDTLQSVATDVSPIKQATVELNNTVTAMQERLGEAEGRIAHLEEMAEPLLNDKGSKDKQTEQLWNRVQAPENHSRRNNLAQKRKAFTPVKRKLHKLDIRHTLAFPATLHFLWRGKNMSCNTVEAAEKVINEQGPGGTVD
eukprot:superscaffoldBa00002808_g15348